MGFKLPMQNRLRSNKSSLGFINSNEEAAPGTPLFRKTLSKGVMAEANDDGSIFISDKIVPNSPEERSILTHEMRHMTQMKTGKLSYTDDTIYWDGNTYQRLKNGKILFEGKEYDEGDSKLPWESAAM